MTTIIENPIDMSSTFDSRLNEGDLDGLLELLAEDAVSRTPQGELLSDTHDIRENLAGLIAAGAILHNRPRHVFTAGNVALLLIDWTLQLSKAEGAPTLTGTTANVVTRKSADDGWRLAILNPAGTN